MNDNKTKNSKHQSGSKAVSTNKQSGALRLMKDLKDWMKSKDEFPCINAVPLEENIFEWHCNICPDSGDFKDVIFHVIIYFDEEYPVLPPKVKLCTTIPHPHVIDEWICLDTIKRDNSDNGYSVTSIIMQLESFLFCQPSSVNQMNDGNDGDNINVDGSFDGNTIEKFVCDKCKHCYKEPFPVTLSISKQLGLGMVDNKRQELKIKCKDNQHNNGFCLWDGLYHDVEMLILNYLEIKEVMKMKKVHKRFRRLVYNSKMIQKNCIKWWIHRSGENKFTTKMLCLGVGVNRILIEKLTLKEQLFGSPSIRDKIGYLKMIKSIDTTFDLLSSDAFVEYDIRSTQFNDCMFKYFIPLYINEKHGKEAIKEMDKFVLRLWNIFQTRKNGKYNYKCHPWLKLYTIGNMMKSLVVSVMKSCDDNYGLISMNYCVNVVKTYFRLHHTLIAIYLTHREEISPLLEYQIEMFFSKDTKNGDGYCHRDEKHIPDLGVFLSYLTLWENNFKKINNNSNNNTNNNKKFTWVDVVYELLDEIFTRQSKSVLNANNDLINPKCCSLNERVLFYWKTNISSNRLFLLNCFFFRKCWNTNRSLSLQEQFDLYNNNFGFLPNDDNSLAFKLKKFVENIHYNVNNFKDFFETIGVEYIAKKHLGLWFIKCMNKSEYRGYHKRDLYVLKYPQLSCKIGKKERKDWIKQQQTERAELEKQREKDVKKQKRLGKRRLQQFEEARMRLVINYNTELCSPVEGIFSFSQVTGDRVVADNVEPRRIEKQFGSGDYLRVYLKIEQLSDNVEPRRIEKQFGSGDYLRVYLKIEQLSDDVASMNEMIIDGFEIEPRLNYVTRELEADSKVLFGKLFDRFANNKDGTMSRNDVKNYIIYYDVRNCFSSDVCFHDRVRKIFNMYSNDSTKEKLTKGEWFKFWRDGQDFAYFTTNQIVHYPETFGDDGLTMPIKIRKANNGIYYSDFCLSGIFGQFGSMRWLPADIRVRGKYIDGSCFECVVESRGDIKTPSSHTLPMVPMVPMQPVAPVPPVPPVSITPPRQIEQVHVMDSEKIEQQYPQQQQQHQYQDRIIEPMGTYIQLQVVNPTTCQLNVSQKIDNYCNQAQLVPLYTQCQQSYFGNQGSGGNGIVVYLVPSAMAQMQPMQPMQQVQLVQLVQVQQQQQQQEQAQAQQFSYMEQRAPMPQAMPHGMHNGGKPRRSSMKTVSSNNYINLDCDEDKKSSVGTMFTRDNASIATKDFS